MKRIVTFVLISAAVLATQVVAGADLKPATKIVAQPNAPLVIASYSARYHERSQYVTEGIHHAVQFENKSGRDVEAVQFGFVSFDVWNRFLDRTNGLSIKTITAGKAERGTWVATALSDFSFLTGVAYINRVRFSDGTIWTADMDAVVEELRKIETDFDAALLKNEPKPPSPE
jgi:hypothetical protein